NWSTLSSPPASGNRTRGYPADGAAGLSSGAGGSAAAAARARAAARPRAAGRNGRVMGAALREGAWRPSTISRVATEGERGASAPGGTERQSRRVPPGADAPARLGSATLL